MKRKKTIIILLTMCLLLILGIPAYADNNTAFTRGPSYFYTSLGVSREATLSGRIMLDYKTPIAIMPTPKSIRERDFYKAKVYYNGKIRTGYILTYHVRKFTTKVYTGKTAYKTRMRLTNGKLKTIPRNTTIAVKFGKDDQLYGAVKIKGKIYKGYIYVLAVRLD